MSGDMGLAGGLLMNIYRIVFRVRPKPSHPAYWEIQFGELAFWFHDDNPESATERGVKIIQCLPYDIVEGPFPQILPSEDIIKDDQLRQTCVQSLKQTGLGVEYYWANTGRDEPEGWTRPGNKGSSI
jgi:hypothetical protein